MIDTDFIEKLNEKGGQGGLFLGGPSQTIQAAFIKSVLLYVQPRSILEIGTHRGNFCYFTKCVLPHADIVTFGIDPESEKSVDMINDRLMSNIRFILGNSLETVPEYNGTADLAWADGGHDYDTAVEDLRNCADKNIPHLLLDDVGMPSVQKAMIDFLVERDDYGIVWMSPDVRGTVYLSKEKIEDHALLWSSIVTPFLRDLLTGSN